MARKRRWGTLSLEEKKRIRAEIAKDKACKITTQSLAKQHSLAEQALGAVIYHERVKLGYIEKTPDGKSSRYKARLARRWRPANVERTESNGEAAADAAAIQQPTRQPPPTVDTVVAEELTREELLLRNAHLAELLDEANRRNSVLKTANRGLLDTLQSVMEC